MHARSLLVASLAAGPAADADMQAPYGGRAGPSRTRPPRQAAASSWSGQGMESTDDGTCAIQSLRGGCLGPDLAAAAGVAWHMWSSLDLFGADVRFCLRRAGTQLMPVTATSYE